MSTLATEVIQKLEEACDVQEIREVVLPSGRSIIVFPTDAMQHLATAFQDPAFEKAIGRAAEDFKLGRGGAFELDR